MPSIGPQRRLSTDADANAHVSLSVPVDPVSSDHCSVASHAKSIAKTTNPVAAEIMKERSNQSIWTYPAARTKWSSVTSPNRANLRSRKAFGLALLDYVTGYR